MTSAIFPPDFGPFDVTPGSFPSVRLAMLVTFGAIWT